MKPLYDALRFTAYLKEGVSRARRHSQLQMQLQMQLHERSRVIDLYLRFHDIRKLQIGAGRNSLPGWLNSDFKLDGSKCVYIDATKPLPFGDALFDYVFSEHLIEHISYSNGVGMLRECFRILRPGGKIRIATPDLAVIIGLYAEPKTEAQLRYIAWITEKWLPEAPTCRDVFVINNAFRRWGHQFLYDRSTLQLALESVGFVEVSPREVGESDDENLRGIESHGKSVSNEEANRFETMVLEARRPA